MPQGDYIELHRKRFGRRFDHYERLRKRKAREAKLRALKAKTLTGIKAKIYHEQQLLSSQSAGILQEFPELYQGTGRL